MDRAVLQRLYERRPAASAGSAGGYRPADLFGLEGAQGGSSPKCRRPMGRLLLGGRPGGFQAGKLDFPDGNLLCGGARRREGRFDPLR